MSSFGGFSTILILIYIVVFAATIGTMYWLMRYLRQLTRVNGVKEKLLMIELKEEMKAASQSSSEST